MLILVFLRTVDKSLPYFERLYYLYKSSSFKKVEVLHRAKGKVNESSDTLCSALGLVKSFQKEQGAHLAASGLLLSLFCKIRNEGDGAV